MLNEDYGIWLDDISRENYPRGILPTETEILIIGGGITGATSAYLLSKKGEKVILLEKGKLGESVTCCTTGFLTQVIDTNPIKLIRLFGQEKASLILKSHFDAINDIENIIKTEKINCDFKRCTNYIYANSSREEKKLLKMTKAFQKLGVNAEYKKDNAIKFSTFGYIEIANQAKFHPIKYINALAKLAKSYGAIISENTKVLNIDNKKEFVTAEIENAGYLKASKVMSATYIPFGKQSFIPNHCNMYRSYVVEYRLPTATITENTYQDNLIPYHYFRIDKEKNNDRILIGGADHMDTIKMNRELNYEAIEKYTEKLFKNKYQRIQYWSGPILNSVDGLPYIGELKDENIFYAFGFSGNGMTYSYIASKILLDKLTSIKNPYVLTYDINRRIPWWANIFG